MSEHLDPFVDGELCPPQKYAGATISHLPEVEILPNRAYEIVVGTDLDDLARIVNEWAVEGYVPLGGPIFDGRARDGLPWLQAMWRAELE